MRGPDQPHAPSACHCCTEPSLLQDLKSHALSRRPPLEALDLTSGRLELTIEPGLADFWVDEPAGAVDERCRHAYLKLRTATLSDQERERGSIVSHYEHRRLGRRVPSALAGRLEADERVVEHRTRVRLTGVESLTEGVCKSTRGGECGRFSSRGRARGEASGRHS